MNLNNQDLEFIGVALVFLAILGAIILCLLVVEDNYS